MNKPHLQLIDFSKFQNALGECANAVNEEMDRLLPMHEGRESRLIEAMRYSSIDGGKKLRPFLVLSSAGLFGVSRSSALRVAAAVEFLHCYSLIHDDLPCMDNSELRRGRSSCHIEYDEATAVLAGDGLLTFCFEVLASPHTHPDPNVRVELMSKLAAAAGPYGMVGGQMLDIESERSEETEWNIGAVTRLQRLKTGELFAFACEASAILGKQPHQIRQSLHAYAHDMGLAFQITDDLLDAEAAESEVGKPVRRDVIEGKPTFVSILGIDRARRQAKILSDQAVEHLDVFDKSADLLRDLGRYVVERSC
jgi:farnesyl diphosphate synthase